MNSLLKVWTAVIVLVVGAAGAAVAQSQDVPKSLARFAQESLTKIGQDAELVALVEKSNGSPQDIAKLKALDAKWKSKDNVEGFVKNLMASPASARLGRIIGEHTYLPEAFIMDAQGTIIGETNRTSTYWKGEQEKFTAAYNGGAGAVWYGTLEFDESTKTNAVQISVPVAKGGKALGAICFTVNVDAWEKR
jgi:hypothetical protein